MVKAKCANCGTETEFLKLPKKFICQSCGILNTPVPETYGTASQACGCLLPDKPEWLLPTGCLKSPIDELHDIYTTADDATGISRLDWITIYGYDPKVVLANMRKLGQEGVPGYVNLSTLGEKKK